MKAYLNFVRSLPCVQCGSHPVDPHHLIGHGRLSSKKHDDLFAFALCRKHHDALHDHGWKQWEEIYGSQFEHVARTLAFYLRETSG